MKKKKKLDLSPESIERIVSIAQEEKKPFAAIKLEFGINESEVIEIMRKKLPKNEFDNWKKKVGTNKPKPKQKRFNVIEDDELDTKYYFKNKFD